MSRPRSKKPTSFMKPAKKSRKWNNTKSKSTSTSLIKSKKLTKRTFASKSKKQEISRTSCIGKIFKSQRRSSSYGCSRVSLMLKSTSLSWSRCPSENAKKAEIWSTRLWLTRTVRSHRLRTILQTRLRRSRGDSRMLLRCSRKKLKLNSSSIERTSQRRNVSGLRYSRRAQNKPS